MILYSPDDTENTYYEQYNTCAGAVKTGDFVYVATDGGRQQIAQIDAIWLTKEYVTRYLAVNSIKLIEPVKTIT